METFERIVTQDGGAHTANMEKKKKKQHTDALKAPHFQQCSEFYANLVGYLP